MKKNSNHPSLLQAFIANENNSSAGTVNAEALTAVMRRKAEKDAEREADRILTEIENIENRFAVQLASLRRIREQERQQNMRIKNLSKAIEDFQKDRNMEKLKKTFSEHENKTYVFKKNSR